MEKFIYKDGLIVKQTRDNCSTCGDKFTDNNMNINKAKQTKKGYYLANTVCKKCNVKRNKSWVIRKEREDIKKSNFNPKKYYDMQLNKLMRDSERLDNSIDKDVFFDQIIKLRHDMLYLKAGIS